MLPAGVVVRRLAPRDIDEVVAIEREAFTSPWSARTFEGLLERDTVELLVLAEEAGGEGVSSRVMGYAVLWCIVDQGELANFALAAAHRGSGLGRRFLERVLGVARERGVRKLFLEVRRSNEIALALYKGAGFAEVGIRPAYYSEPTEDAIVMMAEL